MYIERGRSNSTACCFDLDGRRHSCYSDLVWVSGLFIHSTVRRHVFVRGATEALLEKTRRYYFVLLSWEESSWGRWEVRRWRLYCCCCCCCDRFHHVQPLLCYYYSYNDNTDCVSTVVRREWKNCRCSSCPRLVCSFVRSPVVKCGCRGTPKQPLQLSSPPFVVHCWRCALRYETVVTSLPPSFFQIKRNSDGR